MARAGEVLKVAVGPWALPSGHQQDKGYLYGNDSSGELADMEAWSCPFTCHSFLCFPQLESLQTLLGADPGRRLRLQAGCHPISQTARLPREIASDVRVTFSSPCLCR